MPVSDVVMTREQFESSEEMLRVHRESAIRAERIEAARITATGEACLDDGTAWRYSVLDNAQVRIEKCLQAVRELRVPADIGGLPVTSLAPDAIAYLTDVVSVVVPDCVQTIGGCAFRGDTSLLSAVLPDSVAEFNSEWFRDCAALESLALPGGLRRLTSSIFDIRNLHFLRIGRETSEVDPGAFSKSKLKRIEIAKGNEHLSTDGFAIYDAEATMLLALAVPANRYTVLPTCTEIARKGMSNCAELVDVELPDGLREIGPYAFAHTSIRDLVMPRDLRIIGERALFACPHLSHVELKEGLVRIGAHAFTSTALGELCLPASIESLEYPLAAGSGLTFSGPAATCTIAAGSRRLALDSQGVLYRKGDAGAELLFAMDDHVADYRIMPGTVAIAPSAFANHAEIETVDVPEGVNRIGDAAFRGCRNLRRVTLPEGLESIGDEAFLDTGLEAIALPSTLRSIGSNALVTCGAHNDKAKRSLREVSVAAGSPKFYADSGILMQRWSNGKSQVVLYADGSDVVRIPEEVVSVAPYAFNGARGVRELYLSDRITQVGMRGLSFNCFIELIHVDLEKPIEGKSFVELRFPPVDRSVQQIQFAFNSSDSVSLESLFEHYDNAVVAGNNYDAKADGRLGAYEQCRLIVERLRDPLFMSAYNRSMFERIIGGTIEEICVDCARHDDRRMLDELRELGFLTLDTIDGVIERVSALQDAATTGHLLEMKRRHFGMDAFDFEL